MWLCRWRADSAAQNACSQVLSAHPAHLDTAALRPTSESETPTPFCQVPCSRPSWVWISAGALWSQSGGRSTCVSTSRLNFFLDSILYPRMLCNKHHLLTLSQLPRACGSSRSGVSILDTPSTAPGGPHARPQHPPLPCLDEYPRQPLPRPQRSEPSAVSQTVHVKVGPVGGQDSRCGHIQTGHRPTALPGIEGPRGEAGVEGPTQGPDM